MSREVRVRFAPSPTGPLHMGGVRTALYNYLFARRHGGKMILRIEDTDSQRFVPGAEDYIIESLKWCGIEIDEGVGVGGPHAPYRQSERKEIYLKYAKQLVEAGWAYYAFDTAEELDALRKQAEAEGQTFAYNYSVREKLPTSLSLSAEEVEERIARGDIWVVRFKMPENEIVEMDDLIRGHVKVNTSTLDDKVLYKSADALPTYHLANIVDDHLMQISHVMRAQEWIPSTPLHVQMYRSFGWEHPEFCHLPMVNGSDGKKLSKRHGSTSLNEFRARGYLPQAIVNYVALLGCSYEDGRDMYTLEELGKLFKLEHLNKAPAVFDYKKLEWYNGQYIRALTDEQLYQWTLPFITGTGDATLEINPDNPQPKPKVGPEYSGVAMGPDGEPVCTDTSMGMDSAEVKRQLLALMPLIKERLHFLTDAAEMVHFLFTEPAVPPKTDIIPKKLDEAKTKEVLEKAKTFVAEIFGKSHEEAEELAKKYAEELGIKLGDFMMPVRMAVTGSRVSPPLIGSIWILGKEKAVARVEKTLATF